MAASELRVLEIVFAPLFKGAVHHADAPLIALQQAHQDFLRRAFPSAARAEETKYFTRRNGEGKVVHGRRSAAVSKRQAFHRDHAALRRAPRGAIYH